MDELEHTFEDAALDVPTPARAVGAAVIDRIGVRARAINALEADQLVDMLDFVQTARSEAAEIAPALATGAGQAAVHDLSLTLGVAPGVVSTRLAMARRIRGLLPSVWRSFLAGSVSSWHLTKVDTQLRRLSRPDSPAELDEAIATYAAEHTPTQTSRWLARQVERLESDAATQRHQRAKAVRFPQDRGGISYKE